MPDTKKEYIKKHPKSQLANKLLTNEWPNNAKITIGGGLITPHDKRSNLYKDLQSSKNGLFCIGGHRQRGTEGWWFATY